MSESRERKPGELLPIGLAVVGVLVRLGFPDVSDEALPMRKAFEMWGWSTGRVTLDPETAGWPSLSFYAHLLLQHLHYGLGRLTGAFADRYDYFVAAWPDMKSIVGPARALSVAAAAAIIWSGARLAQRLAGPWGAWLTGLLLVLSPLLLEHSQLVTPDILVACFAALAIGRIVAIHERGRVADDLWAGIWIGLGISSKYTPVLLLPAVFVAHGLRRGGESSPRSALRLAFLQRGPWLALSAAMIVFAATSPYVLLHLGTLARDVGYQAAHLTQGHFGQESTRGISYYPQVLARGLGWTGLGVCVLGLVWGSWKWRGPWLLLLACLVPYYLGLSLLATQFPRYMLPLLMPLAVGASAVLRVLQSIRPAPTRAALTAVLTIVALAPAGVESWRHHRTKSQPTTHQLANRYLEQVPGSDSLHIAAELMSVSLPTARAAARLDESVLQRLSLLQRARVLGRRSFEIDHIPMNMTRPEWSAFYYDLRHFLPYDRIVVSEGVRARYQADPARFPAQSVFYRDLDRYGTLVFRADPSQGARGSEIRIYRLHPDSAARLVRDRGPLDLDRAVTAAGPLHMPTYVRFLEGVARAAVAKEDWVAAERYYRELWTAAPRAGFSDEERAELERMIEDLRRSSAAP